MSGGLERVTIWALLLLGCGDVVAVSGTGVSSSGAGGEVSQGATWGVGASLPWTGATDATTTTTTTTSTAAGGQGGAAPSPPVWLPGDAALYVRYGGYWHGGWGWYGVYAELSPAQQEAIDHLALVPVPPNSPCWSDNIEVHFEIEGANPRTHYAACDPPTVDSCIGHASMLTEAVTCSSFSALRKTLPQCRNCNGFGNNCSTITEVSVDDGCRHNPGSEDAFIFEVSAPGTYTFGTQHSSHCSGSITLQDEEGETITSWSPVCPTASYTFTHPGKYRLAVDGVWSLFLRSGP